MTQKTTKPTLLVTALLFFVLAHQAYAATVTDDGGGNFHINGTHWDAWATTYSPTYTAQDVINNNTSGGMPALQSVSGRYPTPTGSVCSIAVVGGSCGQNILLLIAEYGAPSYPYPNINQYSSYVLVEIYNNVIYPVAFTNFQVDQTNGNLNAQGTWNVGNELDLTEFDTISGTRQLFGSPIIATTTGTFNITLPIYDTAITIGSASTTYSLTPDTQFFGNLYQISAGYNPFTGVGTAPLLLAATSTTITATTSRTVQGGGINPFTVATFGTSTLPNTTDFLSFLNVPKLLETKIPFAYFFQIANGISAGIQATTSTQIPSGMFVWSGINGTSSIDMFSTTTIGHYLSPALIGLWRGFLLVVLLIDFGYNLYMRAKSHSLI